MSRARCLSLLASVCLFGVACGYESSEPPRDVEMGERPPAPQVPQPPTEPPVPPLPPPLPAPPTVAWSTGGQVASHVVPSGKTRAEFQLWGAGGGGGAPGAGGGGAWIQAWFPVNAGDTLEIRVAAGGAAYGGGGGASYVLRNGVVMLIAAGGGGGGVDGCSGCSTVLGERRGAGGGGGPVGGMGQDGTSNDHLQTNSGGGGGATQTAGGVPGVSNDQNPYGYDECTAHGFKGAANQGGAARQCSGGSVAAACLQVGGQGIGNGSGGGGGAGYFGGGSGAHKWTYTGGGGGGGSSWIHPSATLMASMGGDGQQPGGVGSTDFAFWAGLGGAPELGPFSDPAQPGAFGVVTLRLW
ncbi:hypothetical protein WA016_01475 [Myxococcus stipitatus]